MSLNSIPRPVQAIKWELLGSSSKVTRNCQSCRDPRRWYGGPSRYPLPSCLISPIKDNIYNTIKGKKKHDFKNPEFLGESSWGQPMPYLEIKLLYFASPTGKRQRDRIVSTSFLQPLALQEYWEMTIPKFPNKPGQRMAGNLEIKIPGHLGRLLYFKIFLLITPSMRKLRLDYK